MPRKGEAGEVSGAHREPMATQETPLFGSQAKAARAHPAPNNPGAWLLGLVVLVVAVVALVVGVPALESLRAQTGCAADVAAATQSTCSR